MIELIMFSFIGSSFATVLYDPAWYGVCVLSLTWLMVNLVNGYREL